MYRLLSDSAISGVPTVVIPGVVAATGSSPVPAAQTSNVESAKPMPIDTGNSDAEMLMLIQKDKERNQTTSTTSTTLQMTTTSAVATTTKLPQTTATSSTTTTTTTTTTTKRPIPDFDLETPWHLLKPLQAPHQQSSESLSTSTITSKPSSLLFDNDPKPHPILNINFPGRYPSTTTSTTTSTTLPTSTSAKPMTKPSTKSPKITVFDLETPWDTLKNHLPSTESTVPSTEPSTTVTEAPTTTSLSPITSTSHSKPLTTQEVVILKYNHSNQSVATYQPPMQQFSTTSEYVPLSSTPAPLPVESDYDIPVIISKPETYLSETDVAEEDDLNSVTIDNQDAANFPVDDDIDDAFSYITTLLDNPLQQKSLSKKPIRKQINPPIRVVFKGFNEFPTVL